MIKKMENKALFIALASLIIAANAEWNLQGADLTILTGSSASLTCEYAIPENFTDGLGSLLQAWSVKDESGSYQMLFFKEEGTSTSDERMTVSFDEDKMTLNIDDVKLDDEKTYQCILHGVEGSPSSTVELTVNQSPEDVYVENYDTSPVDGESAHVATCISKGSKPAPTIWFTDSDGSKVDSLDDVEDTELENGLFNSVAKLSRVFHKNENGMIYTCHIKHQDTAEMTQETSPVDVRYTPTAKLENVAENEQKEMQEGNRFEASCIADGNPTPTVVWSFQPDPNTNFTMPEDQLLPEGFVVSDDGSTIVMESVAVTDESSTNNGTYQCKASNEVGNVILSFRLGVYAAPVTTVATTQALVETAQPPGMTPDAQPKTAGSDAAVIGGVVAVAVFVLIVAVVLIARYFMSHKGTYHTHEIKERDMEEGGEDEHPMVDDDDELVEKKRTEYFM